MTLRPTKGNVFIQPVDEVKSTILHVPEKQRGEMPRYGRVIAVGGCRMTKKGVKVQAEMKAGDMVYFSKYTGLWVDFEDKQIIQVKQHDIEAVVG